MCSQSTKTHRQAALSKDILQELARTPSPAKTATTRGRAIYPIMSGRHLSGRVAQTVVQEDFERPERSTEKIKKLGCQGKHRKSPTPSRHSCPGPRCEKNRQSSERRVGGREKEVCRRKCWIRGQKLQGFGQIECHAVCPKLCSFCRLATLYSVSNERWPVLLRAGCQVHL